MDSGFEKDKAAEAASRVRGVADLINNLSVDPSRTPKDDWEIKQDIGSELGWSPFVDQEDIAVTVAEARSQMGHGDISNTGLIPYEIAFVRVIFPGDIGRITAEQFHNRKENTVEDKDAYIKKLHARQDEWNAEIDKLRAEAEKAQAESLIEFQNQIEKLRKRRHGEDRDGEPS